MWLNGSKRLLKGRIRSHRAIGGSNNTNRGMDGIQGVGCRIRKFRLTLTRADGFGKVIADNFQHPIREQATAISRWERSQQIRQIQGAKHITITQEELFISKHRKQ